MPKGFVIKTDEKKLPTHEVRWRIPGDVWAGVELAARRNSVEAQDVVIHALRRALRVEIAAARDIPDGAPAPPGDGAPSSGS